MPKLFKKRLFNQRGITLIELIAVILIIGIIAAVGIPVVFNQISNAEEEADKANAAIVTAALERYALLNEGYPVVASFTALKNILIDDEVTGGPYLRADFPETAKTTDSAWILLDKDGNAFAGGGGKSVYSVVVVEPEDD